MRQHQSKSRFMTECADSLRGIDKLEIWRVLKEKIKLLEDNSVNVMSFKRISRISRAIRMYGGERLEV